MHILKKCNSLGLLCMNILANLVQSSERKVLGINTDVRMKKKDIFFYKNQTPIKKKQEEERANGHANFSII